MNSYYILQICLTCLLLITMITGRALHYDQSDEEDNSDLFVYEAETKDNADVKSEDTSYDGNDNTDIDSHEERKFYERSIFGTSRPPHFVSARTREAFLDFLQKAVDKNWRPNLKHYNPSTRFGRHRR